MGEGSTKAPRQDGIALAQEKEECWCDQRERAEDREDRSLVMGPNGPLQRLVVFITILGNLRREITPFCAKISPVASGKPQMVQGLMVIAFWKKLVNFACFPMMPPSSSSPPLLLLLFSSPPLLLSPSPVPICTAPEPCPWLTLTCSGKWKKGLVYLPSHRHW